MSLFRPEYPITKEGQRFGKLQAFVVVPLNIVCIFTIGILLDYYIMDDFYSGYKENPLWGIPQLNKAIWFVFSWLGIGVTGTAVFTTIFMTLFNVRRSNLKHAIVAKIGVNSNWLDKNADSRDKFCQADDEQLALRGMVTFKSMIIPFFLVLIPLSIFLYQLFTNQVTASSGIWISFFLIAFLFFISGVIRPVSRIVFNRQQGTVTYFCFFFWHRTIPFSKVQINAYDGYFRLAMPFRLFCLNIIGDYYKAQEWWSFYMWYMDKNRPLPPGTLFDSATRQRDYERRKAEGFPPPLYESTVQMTDVDGDNQRYNTHKKFNKAT